MRTPEELAAIIEQAYRVALAEAPPLLRESPAFHEQLRRACDEAVIETLLAAEERAQEREADEGPVAA